MAARRIGRVIWLLWLGVWLGAGLSSYFFAAPAIFEFVGSVLADSSEAGTLAGAVFARQSAMTLLVLPVLLGGWGWLGRGTSRRAQWAVLLLLGAAFLLALLEAFYITPQIETLRMELGARFGTVAAAPGEDPDRRRFGMLHGASMVRALVELLLGGVAFLLAGLAEAEARKKAGEANA